MNEWLECIGCGERHDTMAALYRCPRCDDLLSFERDRSSGGTISRALFDARLGGRNPLDRSGVWRFRERLVAAAAGDIVTHPEGSTNLYERQALSDWAGVGKLQFKHEGENPTGSFKDRGMTVAVTQAVRLGARAVACASTGNTSASLAAYAAQAGLRGVVFVPVGKISLGKLAQTLAYGALCLSVRGDFDAAMKLVAEACSKLDIYMVNSINPFRIEGQKTIVWELLQDRNWSVPDWIFLPAGNLGNTSAFGKALREAYVEGWIDRLPRLAAIQATGANPFFRSFEEAFATRHRVMPETIASAIRIGDPVSYDKARLAISLTSGIVDHVSDDELLAAKSAIDRAGIGCEPASACTLAGLRKLRLAGVVEEGADVVCVLTGHVLKDTDVILQSPAAATQIIEIDPSIGAVERALKSW